MAFFRGEVRAKDGRRLFVSQLWDSPEKAATACFVGRPTATVCHVYPVRRIGLKWESVEGAETVYDKVAIPPPTSPVGRPLTIEMVPVTTWGLNLRAALTQKDWRALGAWRAEQVGRVCEICGRVGKRHAVECHERWLFRDGKQIVEGVTLLCPMCHKVKHFGRMEILGYAADALTHLRIVNGGWLAQHAEEHLKNAKAEWRRRSAVNWQVDMTWVLRGDRPVMGKISQGRIQEILMGTGTAVRNAEMVGRYKRW